MNNFNFLILFLLIASTLQPLLQARYEAMRRARQIATIERERGSRVITMIHRQETRWFFGLPVSRMIDLEDAQQIIPAIMETPQDTPIDLILHTPGGRSWPQCKSPVPSMRILRRSRFTCRSMSCLAAH